MSRPAPVALLAAARAAVVRPFMACELLYPEGPVRLCSLPQGHVILVDGQSYAGTGVLGRITELEEGAENRSYGFSLELSGIPGNWADYLRSQDVQGGLVTIRLGMCDENWGVIGSEIVTVGRMDTQDVQAGETTFVRVNCEGPHVDWERPRVRRATDIDQQARAPGDRFFRFSAAMRNFREQWGRS
jgi:hypothetical protein